jgi:hypothetical protein
MKTKLSYAALFVLFATYCWSGLSEHDKKEGYLNYRINKPLTAEEKAITGKWKGSYGTENYEILRKLDGSYSSVAEGIFNGEKYQEYYEGVWWIKDGLYFYLCLKSSDPGPAFDDYPYFEEIVKIGEKEFITKDINSESQDFVNELKIEEFQLKSWKLYTEKD